MSPVPGHGRLTLQAEVGDTDIRGASWRRAESRPAAARRQIRFWYPGLENESDSGHALSGSVQALRSPTLPKASAI
jgi:hypothetical protein